MEFTSKHLTILGVVLVIGFFSFAIHDNHMKNLPEVIPTEVIKEEVMNLIDQDSTVIVPVNYTYVDNGFESSSNVSYWFIYYERYNSSDDKEKGSTVISIPNPFFDFYKAGDIIAADKYKHVFIHRFKRISEASYKSYDKYAAKY